MTQSKLLTEQQRNDLFNAIVTAFPHARCELNYTNPFTLMVAIILSAQSTDKGVNKATPALFAKADTPKKMLKLGADGVREYVKSLNYFNNKTKSIIGLSQALVDKFNGELPKTFEELITLPGVGRKTANVFLNVLYRAPTIGVDTHVFRLAHRLKITTGKTPEEVEKNLVKLVPEQYKPDIALSTVLLGRYICTAKKPKCDKCPIWNFCYADEKKLLH